jgi:CXXX repeat radical SAM target protein
MIMIENMPIFLKRFKELFPFVFDKSIFTEKELTESLRWYQSQQSNRQDCTFCQFFFDWVVSAIEGDKKSIGFLSFYNQVLSELSSLYNDNFPNEIKRKIRNSILERPENKYKNNIGELFTIWHLLKRFNNECEFLGTDFNLGNGKDADIAFKKGSSIQLIEIKNHHNLAGKNIVDEIKQKIIDKKKSKTQKVELVKKRFANIYPDCEVILSFLLFVWDDYANLAYRPFNDRLNAELEDDFMPPITIINQQLKDGEFLWQICNLEDAIHMFQESQKAIRTEESIQDSELLTRRGFFKQVAKTVLPVIGGVIMSSLPFKTFASSQNCTDCTFNCSTACAAYCSGSCTFGCTTSCTGCKGTCSFGCTTSCTGCKGTCSFECTRSCASNCSGSCSGFIQSSTSNNGRGNVSSSTSNNGRGNVSSSRTGCGGNCSSKCTGKCSSSCSGACAVGCGGCSASCSGVCSGRCSSSCSYNCSGSCGGCRGRCRNCN